MMLQEYELYNNTLGVAGATQKLRHSVIAPYNVVVISQGFPFSRKITFALSALLWLVLVRLQIGIWTLLWGGSVDFGCTGPKTAAELIRNTNLRAAKREQSEESRVESLPLSRRSFEFNAKQKSRRDDKSKKKKTLYRF